MLSLTRSHAHDCNLIFCSTEGWCLKLWGANRAVTTVAEIRGTLFTTLIKKEGSFQYCSPVNANVQDIYPFRLKAVFESSQFDWIDQCCMATFQTGNVPGETRL